MATVYAATDEQLHRTVAIKLLKDVRDDQGARLALREARAAAQLRSEHVARVLDAGLDGEGTPYIVMEFLEGEDLRRRLEVASVQVGDAVGFIIQACEAIAEAHAAGFVHRDLKPDNLFITHGVGGLPHVKVLDFGIAKLTRSESHHTTGGKGDDGLFGSPPYTAPERLRNVKSVDPRSDIWSLGVVLYEALTNTRPFVGANIPELLVSILDDTPRSIRDVRPDVPESVVTAVRCCLEKDPEARFQSVALLSERLLPFAPEWAQAAGQRTLLMAGRGRCEGSSAASSAERPAAATTTEAPSVQEPALSRKRRQQLPVVAATAIVLAIGSIALLRHEGPRAPGMAPPATAAELPAAPTKSISEDAVTTDTEAASTAPPAEAAPRPHTKALRTTRARVAKPELDPLAGRK
jgi:serine/threonine-protein kinase